MFVFSACFLSFFFFFFSSRRRHTRYIGDWSSDVCSSDLAYPFIHATAMRYSREGFNTGFDFGAFVVGVLISTVMTVLWLLALRIGCELAVVLFKIHDALVPKKPVEVAAAPAAPASGWGGTAPEPPKPEAPAAPPAEPPKS